MQGRQEQVNMTDKAQSRSLLDLPPSCLLAIMQHCSSDYHTLFSAARAHSALHVAAVAALSSITLQTANQATLDRLLAYLAKYSQHVKQFSLSSSAPVGQPGVELLQLPPSMQLESLSLEQIKLQLQPCISHSGVLVNQSALKHFKLGDCLMCEGADGLAAVLRELPGLELLKVTNPQTGQWIDFSFPGDALPGLQHLTSLELSQGSTPQLSCLTHLEALCLDPADLERISAEMLGPLSRPTCLRILNSVDIGGYLEPSALAGKARLRHLQARRFFYAWDFGGAAETCTRAFLAELQQLQELTHLDLHGALRFNIGTTAAACYSTITASTDLEHLDICCNKFPPSVWGELFPTSKRMPRLKVVKVSRAHSDDRLSAVGVEWQAADVVQVARCCPALLHLEADGMTYDLERVAALTQFSENPSRACSILCWGSFVRSGHCGGMLFCSCKASSTWSSICMREGRG